MTEALAVALLMGLRHATDPDHLTAVSTLILADERAATRRAGRLGIAWGLGHAVTLLALGLPLVLFGRHLPDAVHRGAEAAVGLVIVGLAARLLVRWRRGAFHAHPHAHGEAVHAHPHAHEGTGHDHAHAEDLGRSPLVSFGIGLVHGVGGSAAAGLLVVTAASGAGEGALALVVYALGTALSMGALSLAFGYGLLRRPVARRLPGIVSALGAAGIVFGAWYAISAIAGAG